MLITCMCTSHYKYHKKQRLFSCTFG